MGLVLAVALGVVIGVLVLANLDKVVEGLGAILLVLALLVAAWFVLPPLARGIAHGYSKLGSSGPWLLLVGFLFIWGFLIRQAVRQMLAIARQPPDVSRTASGGWIGAAFLVSWPIPFIAMAESSDPIIALADPLGLKLVAFAPLLLSVALILTSGAVIIGQRVRGVAAARSRAGAKDFQNPRRSRASPEQARWERQGAASTSVLPSLRPAFADIFSRGVVGPSLREDWINAQSGIELFVEYRRGSQTSANHWPVLNPILRSVFRADLVRGSLNLYATEPVPLPDPLTCLLGNNPWQLSPVVLSHRATGVIARRADTGPSMFCEVFSPQHLATELQLSEGDRIPIRILPGNALFGAA